MGNFYSTCMHRMFDLKKHDLHNAALEQHSNGMEISTRELGFFSVTIFFVSSFYYLIILFNVLLRKIHLIIIMIFRIDLQLEIYKF